MSPGDDTEKLERKENSVEELERKETSAERMGFQWRKARLQNNSKTLCFEASEAASTELSGLPSANEKSQRFSYALPAA